MPSSVTLPPTLEINKTAFISNRLNAGQHHHRQCATFSSGEGFRIVKRFSHCEIFHKIATSAATVGQPQGLSLRSTYDRSTHHYKSGASATRLDQWGAVLRFSLVVAGTTVVHLTALSCQTVLSEENGGSLSRAHTRVRPYNEKENMIIFAKLIYVEAPFLTRR